MKRRMICCMWQALGEKGESVSLQSGPKRRANAFFWVPFAYIRQKKAARSDENPCNAAQKTLTSPFPTVGCGQKTPTGRISSTS